MMSLNLILAIASPLRRLEALNLDIWRMSGIAPEENLSPQQNTDRMVIFQLYHFIHNTLTAI